MYPFAFASLVFAKSSLISLKTPVYVAGFERGVLPIGDWSIFITLSRFSVPLISLKLPYFVCALFSFTERYLYITSFTREDFPEPETPVTQTISPSGISTFIFFKLFAYAPLTDRYFPFPVLLFSGSSISS